MLSLKFIAGCNIINEQDTYIAYLKRSSEKRLLAINNAVSALLEKHHSYTIGIFGSSINQNYLPGEISDIDYICISENEANIFLPEFEESLAKNYMLENHIIDFSQNKSANKIVFSPAEIPAIFNRKEEMLRNAIFTGIFMCKNNAFLVEISKLKERLVQDFYSKNSPKKSFPNSLAFIKKFPAIRRNNTAVNRYDIHMILRIIKTINLILRCYPQTKLSNLENQRLKELYYLYLYIRDYFYILKSAPRKQIFVFPEPVYAQIGKDLFGIPDLPELTKEHNIFINTLLKRLLK